MRGLRWFVLCVAFALCPGFSTEARAAGDPTSLVVAAAAPSISVVETHEKTDQRGGMVRCRPAVPCRCEAAAFVLVTERYLRNCALLR